MYVVYLIGYVLVVCLFVYIIRYVSMPYHLIVFILVFIVALIIVCCSLIRVGEITTCSLTTWSRNELAINTSEFNRRH
jgi:hypothetical protein